MSLNFEEYGEKYYVIKGNAYPYKDKIKMLGAKWNPDLKVWVFPKNLKSKFEESLPVNNNTEQKDENIKNSITKTDFLNLLSRVERLEQLLGQILHTSNKK